MDLVAVWAMIASGVMFGFDRAWAMVLTVLGLAIWMCLSLGVTPFG